MSGSFTVADFPASDAAIGLRLASGSPSVSATSPRPRQLFLLSRGEILTRGDGAAICVKKERDADE